MQKSILLLLDKRFLAEIDDAFPRFGYSDRSTFIREAVIKYMAQLGVKLPIAYKAAPPRVGAAKGGRPKKSLSAIPTPASGKKAARQKAG